MFKKEIMWEGAKLSLETGKFANQADGSVLVTYGETSVLCTVVGNKKESEEVDFFPLSVHFLEKIYSAGRIPGGFQKKDPKPTEREVLISRVIDRSLRPIFPEYFFHDVQIVCTVLSYDGIHATDIISIIGSSAALAISGIPHSSIVAAARVGISKEEFYVNHRMAKDSDFLDLIVSGNSSGIIMVEAGAREINEDKMCEALEFAEKAYAPLIDLIKELAESCKKDTWFVEDKKSTILELNKKIESKYNFAEPYALVEKKERYAALDSLRKKIIEDFSDHKKSLVSQAIDIAESNSIRGKLANTGKRIDGRVISDIRTISCDHGVLPRIHGTGLFSRGETQVLSSITIGTGQDRQTVDSLDGEYKEAFMLSYVFPPFCVGETGRMGAPSRREIGHGNLAARAIAPILPIKNQYAILAIGRVLACHGSSSMATVCATSLALMDAGIEVQKHVAGIAMGLMIYNKKHYILSDIMGDEDAFGDMDFKVAGTDGGITALQMDIKVDGLSISILKEAIEQAKEGINYILNNMNGSISIPKAMKDTVPKISSMKISKDKIRDVIGSGGKTIREICDTYSVKIEIDDSGLVSISGGSQTNITNTINRIQNIIYEPEIDEIIQGRVVKLVNFGAFVSLPNGKDGFLHISEISEERIEDIGDVMRLNDRISARIVGVDDRGKVRLSMRNLI
jgi:polyribonucleotide nucleotidyltransferase